MTRHLRDPLHASPTRLRQPLIAARRLLFAISILVAPFCQSAVIRVERIRVTTSSLSKMEKFYHGALGFHVVDHGILSGAGAERLLGLRKTARTLTMQLGQERVEFMAFARAGRSYPPKSLSPDLWFQHLAIVVSDMDVAYARLRKWHFQPISAGGPQTLPAENGKVRAFKFRDPDGHPLEFLYFPPGQGRSRWAGAAGGALGIDHTAIDVGKTKSSIDFYAGTLGMQVAYEVTNRGMTQENLDDTFGALVRITGLRPTSTEGPGIELLDYRAPSSGRSLPLDSRADDLWHVEIIIKVDSLDETIAAMDRDGMRYVSPGLVRLADGSRAASVLDPDGHVVVIEE